MPNSAIFTVHLVFTVSLVFSGVFLAALRGFGRPIRYMVLFFGVIALSSFANFLYVSNTPFHGLLLCNPLHLLNSLVTYPLLFAYLFCLMRPESVRLRYWLTAYVPLAALVALHLIFDMVRSPLPFFTTYAEIGNCITEPALWVRFAAILLFVAMSCIYIVKAIRMLRQHISNLKSNFSYTEGSTLGWIWWCLSLSLLKLLTLLLLLSVEGQMIKLVCLTIFAVEPVITTVWVLRQKELYADPAQKENGNRETAEDNNGTGLSSERRRKLKQNLLALLEKDEIFKDPELNSEKVRAMLNTNRTYLSQLINQEMNTTFYSLINTCRLNKAMEMMRDPLHRHTPLKNIAEICGFKSMSGFSNLFKQEHGMTPSEWVK
jgi:AraC-like DNA-binding protein